MKLQIVSIFIIFILIGCQQEQEYHQENKKEVLLQNAYNLFVQKKYESALLQYQQQILTIPKDTVLYQESQLAILLCQIFLDQLPPHALQDWKVDTRLYWQGQSFTLWESIPKYHNSLFQTSIKNFPYKSFLLLEFIINQPEFQESFPIEKYIQQYITTEYQSLAWNLILIHSWNHLRKNDVKIARIFLSSVQEFAIQEKQKTEAKTALFIADILQHQISNISLTDPIYSFNLTEIDLYRSNTILAPFKNEKIHIDEEKIYIQADVIYQLGGIAWNPIQVWQTGIEWLQKQHTVSQEMKKLLLSRYTSAQAWTYAMKGQWQRAIEILNNIQGQKHWNDEKQLANIIYIWIQENSLELLTKELSKIVWEDEIWIAGKRFAFLRTEERKKYTEQFQKLPLENKKQLLIFDALCILGDSRSAYGLLGDIMPKLSKENQEIFIIEENNIPNDPYAENQIWEKLD